MKRATLAITVALLRAAAPDKRRAAQAIDRLLPLPMADKRSANTGAVAGSPAAAAPAHPLIRQKA